MENRVDLFHGVEEPAHVILPSKHYQAQDTQANYETMLQANIVELDWLMADIGADICSWSDVITWDSEASVPPAASSQVNQAKMRRAQAILRYRMKTTRKYGSPIIKRQKTKYAARTAVAQRRPRVHGRFL
mmetsp:Transcript_6016/g.10828  ORF Transcript_6016/g.10828 Transcript_6016/m.10828 type:complete len:131 (-) Transcript_6016:1046-1438(-)